jgi:hypothetical protein
VKRILFFFLAIIIVAVNPSCVSKRYAKRGLKFEEAGLYDMAAQAYFRSLKANANNIDARIGLKKNGQRVLDEKVLQVHSAYEASDYKKTVYGYLDAKEYKDMVATLAVELLMPERTTSSITMPSPATSRRFTTKPSCSLRTRSSPRPRPYSPRSRAWSRATGIPTSC